MWASEKKGVKRSRREGNGADIPATRLFPCGSSLELLMPEWLCCPILAITE